MRFLVTLWETTTAVWAEPWVKGLAFAVLGIGLVRHLAGRVETQLSAGEQAARARLGASVFRWVATTLVLVGAADVAGLELGSILATAGLFTLAVGLAAQAGLSNVIAGLFLLLDRPLAVGELVQIDQRIGTIEGMTLLSTWMRTPDNVVVRWPNDFVLKASILNLSRHPTRRLDILGACGTGVDVQRIRERLLPAVEALPSVLPSPPPALVVRSISEQRIELELRCWVPSETQVQLRDALVEVLHTAIVGGGERPAASVRAPATTA